MKFFCPTAIWAEITSILPCFNAYVEWCIPNVFRAQFAKRSVIDLWKPNIVISAAGSKGITNCIWARCMLATWIMMRTSLPVRQKSIGVEQKLWLIELESSFPYSPYLLLCSEFEKKFNQTVQPFHDHWLLHPAWHCMPATSSTSYLEMITWVWMEKMKMLHSSSWMIRLLPWCCSLK